MVDYREILRLDKENYSLQPKANRGKHGDFASYRELLTLAAICL